MFMLSCSGCLPPLCLHSLNVAQAWRDTVSCLRLFTFAGWMVEAETGGFLILWQRCHCQQSEQQRSVIITKDNNAELSCAALPQVKWGSSDIRRFFLPKMRLPACLNGLLDIDFAAQQYDLSFYPVWKAALPFQKKKSFHSVLVRHGNPAAFSSFSRGAFCMWWCVKADLLPCDTVNKRHVQIRCSHMPLQTACTHFATLGSFKSVMDSLRPMWAVLCPCEYIWCHWNNHKMAMFICFH